jgi:hypothetical protein
MKLRAVLFAIILLIIITLSLIITAVWFSDDVTSTSEFFVGVEFAYSYGDQANSSIILNDLKSLVDKVRNYTNLFVIGSLEVSSNQTLLNEACDYIYDAGLSFIVLFTNPYPPYAWLSQAFQKYGVKFLGVYRYDEPGGNQLDRGPSNLVVEADNYTDAAETFVDYLNGHIKFYLNSSPKTFTADYGLYWFDYKGGYTAVLTEIGFNLSRTIQTALCRGAAEAQNKDWGAIITWTHTSYPYIENGTAMYNDMVFAYQNGAKYLAIFDYPKIGQYGILNDDHFDAMKRFWNYTKNNPEDYGANQGEIAYVLPSGYGFGFRSATDTIWGLWPADNFDLSGKIWNDVNMLASEFGSRLDIVYDDPEFNGAFRNQYDQLVFWNETT